MRRRLVFDLQMTSQLTLDKTKAMVSSSFVKSSKHLKLLPKILNCSINSRLRINTVVLTMVESTSTHKLRPKVYKAMAMETCKATCIIARGNALCSLQLSNHGTLRCQGRCESLARF